MVSGMSSTDQALAIKAASAGAAVVRNHYGSTLARFPKGARDFATTADLAAEKAILDILRAARPDDLLVGEESGRSGAGDSGRRWLVDPLCGTLNYAVRSMLVAVNVALQAGTQPVVAAAADPFNDEVFWTDGTAAHLRRGGTDERLVPSADSALVDLNLDPPFPNGEVFQAARILTDAGFTARFHPRVLSTTLAVAWVAAGRRAGFITDGHGLRDSVHFAAGIALCEAAGCVVSGIDGQPAHSGLGGLVVAADERTHRALLKSIENQKPA